MTYEPREGIDYLVDLYAVAGTAPEVGADELKNALKQRILEFHPDRLEGLAPEFKSKGERMARLLNRAKVVLLDADRRQGYDMLLAEWDGPISKDGTPVISINRVLQAEMAGKTDEEIEAIFTEQATQLESLSGYSPNRLSFLEKMIEQASDDISEDLRAEYEDALLSYDRILAIQEAERSRLLSLPDIEKIGYRAGLDYAEDITLEIEAAREAVIERGRVEALGGVARQLALLAGEGTDVFSTSVVVASTQGLPAYFDSQAQKVIEIVSKRQEIVEKRLSNFMPDYPFAELQQAAMNNLAIGMGDGDFKWFKVAFDYTSGSADVQSMPADIFMLLKSGDYKAVIKLGYNVLIYSPLDQIDIKTQLFTCIQKHADKYSTTDSE
jgi:curved DNA-binding protein CbpA